MTKAAQDLCVGAEGAESGAGSTRLIRNDLMSVLSGLIRLAAVTLALAGVCASASANEQDQARFAELLERLEGDVSGLQQEIESRLVDARSRGDVRAELLALRDRIYAFPAVPMPSDVDPERLTRDTLARAQALGDIEIESALLPQRADDRQQSGALDEAARLQQRAADLAERSGNAILQAAVTWSYARFEIDNHHTEAALRLIQQSLTASTKARSRVMQARSLMLFAETFRIPNVISTESLSRSEDFLQRALALLDPARHQSLIADITEDLGLTFLREGKLEMARKAFESVLPSRKPWKIGYAVTSFKLGRVELLQGLPQQAKVPLRTAVADGPTEIRARALVMLARAESLLGNRAAAASNLALAGPAVAALKVPEFQAELEAATAEIALRSGDYKLAYEASRRQFEIEKKQLLGDGTQRVEEMSVKFDLKLKDADNQLLRAEQARAESRRTALILALIMSTIVIAGILMFFVQQFRQRRRFEILALRDELTGAPNRRSVIEHIRSERARAGASRESFVIAIMDIDFFKKVNDTYGHDAGDVVLKQFYAACRARLRPDDMLGRWGGEEFVLVTRTRTEADLNALFERLLAAVKAIDAPELKGECQVTFSMGACRVTADSSTPMEAILARADEGLYAAKQAGRACWRSASPDGVSKAAEPALVLAEQLSEQPEPTDHRTGRRVASERRKKATH